MRTLLFLLLPCPAFSQTFSRPFDHQLSGYLKLTETQIEQLSRNAEAYRDSLGPAAKRLNTVNEEIAAETRKASPSAMELGLRYQELETICREQDAPRLAAYQKQMQVLNETQRGQVRELADAPRLVNLVGAASAAFLIRGLQNSFGFPLVYNGTPYRGPFAGSISFISSGSFTLPQELADYLKLTSDQAERIQTAIRDYHQFFSIRFRRFSEVGAETEKEFGQETPAPGQLGERYLEIESLRREIAEREDTMSRDFQALLTPEQRSLTQVLEQAPLRLQLAFAADGYQLLPSNPKPRPASRPTMGQISFIDQFSATTGGSVSSVLTSRTIYRGCEGGPDFSIAIRIPDFTAAPAARE